MDDRQALKLDFDAPSTQSSTGRSAKATLRPRTTPCLGTTEPTETQTLPEWSHTPSPLVLAWIAVSLPLVLWDTGYVLLRPYSMPGGVLHSPVWKPYALYAEVDQVYSMKAIEEHNGWTAAQASGNVIETAGYLVYLYCVYTYGHQREAMSQGQKQGPRMLRRRTVHGHVAAGMVLLAYSMAWLTFGKTVLYGLIEAFSGFDNIGHNSLFRLIFVYILPNGCWLIFPLYMIFVFGSELLRALKFATDGTGKKHI